MKVLLVGEGARENAIAWKISQEGARVYSIMGYVNPGIKRIVENSGGKFIMGNIRNPNDVLNAAEAFSPELIIVGPEEPLFKGVCDKVREKGFACFGPSFKASKIEESKVWMRNLMWKHKIKGRLRFKSFKSVEEASKYILEYGGSIAIKPSRQAGGRGVKVVADLQAYLTKEKREAVSKSASEIASLAQEEEDKILIEEKVDGVEYTLHVITDGLNVLPLPLAQDYKHAYSYSIGPETGGMGSISGPKELLPFIEEEEFKTSLEIVRETINAIKAEVNEDYIGFIAGQMMLTPLWGPTIIEYYSRLGDPEASAILPRIKSSMLELFDLAVNKGLHRAKIEVDERVSVVKAIAPIGYPLDRKMASNKLVFIDERKIKERGCLVFYGSISEQGEKLITMGSRAIEIAALSDSFEQASRKVDECISYVEIEGGMIYRSEIGKEETIAEQREKSSISRHSYKLRERKGILGVSKDWSPKEELRW
jgi:phosphoribosylamine--glycine ligase